MALPHSTLNLCSPKSSKLISKLLRLQGKQKQKHVSQYAQVSLDLHFPLKGYYPNKHVFIVFRGARGCHVPFCFSHVRQQRASLQAGCSHGAASGTGRLSTAPAQHRGGEPAGSRTPAAWADAPRATPAIAGTGPTGAPKAEQTLLGRKHPGLVYGSLRLPVPWVGTGLGRPRHPAQDHDGAAGSDRLGLRRAQSVVCPRGRPVRGERPPPPFPSPRAGPSRRAGSPLTWARSFRHLGAARSRPSRRRPRQLLARGALPARRHPAPCRSICSRRRSRTAHPPAAPRDATGRRRRAVPCRAAPSPPRSPPAAAQPPPLKAQRAARA